MSGGRILVVDDEEGILEACADTLRHIDGARVVGERESSAALARMEAERFDLVITDIRMPGLDGIELLKKAKEIDPDVAVIMLTAFPAVETAVASMRMGAYDYLVKPFDPEDLLAKARRALSQSALETENRFLTRQLERGYRFSPLIGESLPMQRVQDLIGQVAKTDADVLVLGESGTGKELVARGIHEKSTRRKGKFVPVDSGAIPEHLLESEFFGHEKGAFTGAHATSIGLLEFARGGTFFLDEICELPLSLQAKLLRALQERRFRRVGAHEEIDVDVRIIAATHRDIDTEVKEKRFREDLFYRINVVRIEIPPLRERPGDIPLLVSHFLERFSREMGNFVQGIDPEAVDILSRYPWPGNVRELQNILKRAIVLARHARLRAEDFPDEFVIRSGEAPGKDGSHFYRLRAQKLMSFEQSYFRWLLGQAAGDVALASRQIGMPRATLYRFLKRLGIHPEEFQK